MKFNKMYFACSHGASLEHPVLVTEKQIKDHKLREGGVILYTLEQYRKKKEENENKTIELNQAHDNTLLSE